MSLLVNVIVKGNNDPSNKIQKWTVNIPNTYYQTTVSHLLSDLNNSFPEVLGLHTVAVITHLGLDDKLYHKHLLQDRTIHHLKTKKIKHHAQTHVTPCAPDCMAVITESGSTNERVGPNS